MITFTEYLQESFLSEAERRERDVSVALKYIVEMPYRSSSIPKIGQRDESDLNMHIRHYSGYQAGQKHISKHNGHHVYKLTNPDDQFSHGYLLADSKSKRVKAHITGRTKGNEFTVGWVAKHSSYSGKMTDFYHHLITHHDINMNSSTEHSPGSVANWKKLSERPDIHMTRSMNGEGIRLHTGDDWHKNYEGYDKDMPTRFHASKKKSLKESWKLGQYDSKISGKRKYADNHADIDGHHVHLSISGNKDNDYAVNYTVNGSYYKGSMNPKTGQKITSHVNRSINSAIRHMKPRSMTFSSQDDKRMSIHTGLTKRLARRYGGKTERWDGVNLTHDVVKFHEEYMTENAIQRKLLKGSGGTPLDIPGTKVVHHDPENKITVYHNLTPESLYITGSQTAHCTNTRQKAFAHGYLHSGNMFTIHQSKRRYQFYDLKHDPKNVGGDELKDENSNFVNPHKKPFDTLIPKLKSIPHATRHITTSQWKAPSQEQINKEIEDA